MSTPNVPFKTPLGHDELRTRTHRLSQRHRTILLLVDGRRPLAEVLGLAQQAGSSISHFEDVLRMGLVELPIVVVAPDPVMTEPGALATLRTTAVEVEVALPEPVAVEPEPDPVEALPMLSVQTPPDADALSSRTVTTEDAAMLPAALMVAPDEEAALRALRAHDSAESAAAVSEPSLDGEPHRPAEAQALAAAAPAVLEEAVLPVDAAPTASTSTAAQPVPVPVPLPVPSFDAVAARTASVEPPERAAFPPPQDVPHAAPATQRRRGGRIAARPVAPAAAQPRATRAMPAQLPEPVTLSELAHVPAPQEPPPQLAMPDAALVEQVRTLLAETVRQNPPPFVSRVPSRVNAARTLHELRDLVLDIERYLSARRPRAAVAGLQQARELLGLGNTVVAEDSRSWRDDEDDDAEDVFRTTR